MQVNLKIIIHVFIIQLQQLQMNNLQRQSQLDRLKNYFSRHQEQKFTRVNIEQRQKSNSKQRQIISKKLSSPKQDLHYKFLKERQEFIDNRQNLPVNYPQTLNTQRGKLTHEELLDEIVKLEEIIYFIGMNNDKLIVQNEKIKIQLTSYRISKEKIREQLEIQIKKLKQIIQDKQSQNISLAKQYNRQKIMVDEEKQRMQNNVKAIIQNKNNEIFEENHKHQQILKKIEDNHEKDLEKHKNEQAQLINQLKGQIQTLEKTLQEQRKYKEQMQAQIEEMQSAKQEQTKRQQSKNKKQIQQLKEKYAIQRQGLIKYQGEQLQDLQEKLKIQREVFSSQIQLLQQRIRKSQCQVQNLNGFVKLIEQNSQKQIHQYEQLSRNFKKKIVRIYQLKNQQQEVLKVKYSEILDHHSSQFNEILTLKIKEFTRQIIELNDHIRLQDQLLDKQFSKNNSLVLKIAALQSGHQQQLKRLKLNFKNNEKILKDKFQTEKTIIINQSSQAIKFHQDKQSQLQFQTQQLRKIRKLLEKRSQQVEEKQKIIHELTNIKERQRGSFMLQIQQLKNNHKNEIDNYLQSLSIKQSIIEQLTKELQKKISQFPMPDYTHYQQKLKEYKEKLQHSNLNEKKLVERNFQHQKLIKQLRQQYERINLEKQMIIEQAKQQWQLLSEQKLKDLEDHYKRLLQNLKAQMNQNQSKNDILESQLTKKNIELNQLKYQLDLIKKNLNKRTDLQSKIVLLGLDLNLVKNKKDLFQY